MNTTPVNVAVIDGKTVIETTALQATAGHPVRIKAIANGKYVLAEGDKGIAPEKITVKRVGKDLHVALEGTDPDQPQLIIEGFFDSAGQLVGVGQDGAYHTYLAADAVQDHSAAFLIDGVSAPQVLGTEELAGFGNGLVSGGASIGWFWPALLGLAGVGLLGVANVVGRDDDSDHHDDSVVIPTPSGVGQAGDILSGGSTDDSTPTFTGVGTPGNTMIIKDGDKILGEVLVGKDGKWEFTPDVPLEAGAHEIIVIEKDPRGNQSAPSEGFEIIIDLTAPGKPGEGGVGGIDEVLVDVGGVPTPIGSGGATADTTPTLSGSGREPGEKVQIRDNGNVIGEVIVDENGNWTYTPDPALGEGQHDITLVVIDPAGNASVPSDPYTVIVDTTPPARPGEGGVGGIDEVLVDVGGVPTPIGSGGATGDNSPVLSGGGRQPGEKVQIKDNGVVIGEVPVDENGNWTYTPTPPLGDGPHDITLVVVDPAGNQSEPSDPYTVIVDTTPPAKPGEGGVGGIDEVLVDVDGVLTPIGNGGSTSDTTPTFGGSGQQPGDKVTIKDGDKIIGEVIVGEDGKWSYTPDPALEEGKHDITLIVTDPLGRSSEASDPYTVIIDTLAPGKPGEGGVGGIDEVLVDVDGVPTPIGNGGSTNDTTPTLGGSGQQPGDKVQILDNGKVIAEVEVGADGKWTYTPTPPLGEGAHDITLVVVDAAGNKSEPSDPYTVIVDTTAPAKPGEGGVGGIDEVLVDVDGVPTPIGNGGSTNDTTPTLGGSGQQPGDKVQILDNGKVIDEVEVGADGKWTYTPTPPLAEGAHDITLVVVDPAGNKSEPSDPYTVIVDTTPPAKPGEGGVGGIDEVLVDVDGVPTPIGNGGSTNDTTPTLGGSGQQPGDKVQILDNGKVIDEVEVGADGKWTYTPTPPLAEGAHDITLVVVDPSGNKSEPSDPYTVIVDTTPPAKPGEGGAGGIDEVLVDVGGVPTPIGNGGSTNDTTPTLGGSGQQPGDKVQILDNGKVIKEVVVDSNGKWTYTPTSPLGDGKHNLTLVIVDQAGNASEASDPFTVMVDTVAPELTSVEVNGPVVTVTFDGSDLAVGDTIQVLVGTTPYSLKLTQAQLDAGSINITTTTDASLNNVQVTITDAAGNVSQSLKPESATVNFEDFTVGAIPSGKMDLGVVTFDSGSSTELNIIEEGYSWGGFTCPSRGVGINLAASGTPASMTLADNAEASSMSFMIGALVNTLTLSFYDANHTLVHSYTIPPMVNVAIPVSVQMPDGQTFTSVEFELVGAGGTDWIWMDDFEFTSGGSESGASLTTLPGSEAPFGDDADNILSFSSTAVLNDAAQVISGGDGVDTLLITGADQVLDLDKIAGKLASIEVIDITGTGNNTLNLSLGDVLELGQTSLFIDDDKVQMKINGNAGDVVNLDDQLRDGTDPGNWAAAGQATVGGSSTRSTAIPHWMPNC